MIGACHGDKKCAGDLGTARNCTLSHISRRFIGTPSNDPFSIPAQNRPFEKKRFGPRRLSTHASLTTERSTATLSAKELGTLRRDVVNHAKIQVERNGKPG